MTKIKNTIAYVKDTNITDNDFVIGSDGDLSAKNTKNFFFGDIRDYLLEGLAPEVGGTLKITEISDNTETYSTPEDLANSLTPSFIILQYHIVIFVVNGNKYLLNRQGLSIGDIETPLTSSDFITISSLSNLGNGINVLKGYNETTESQEFKSVTKTGDLILLTDNNSEIDITIDENALITLIGDNQELYTMDNTGTGLGEAAIYKESLTPAPGNTEFVLRSLRSTDNSVTITEETNSVDFSINEDQGFLENGTTTTITGVGSNADKYKVEVNNLQNIVSSFPYTLLDTDDKNTLFINNGVANVVINVPDSLVDNFSCALIQKGTGTIDIVATGTATVNEPSGLDPQIKGQYHWALIEKELATDVYYLGGSLKVTP
jgi:hypothetical protein